MSVKFPDILQHENSNYAIVDINDIRGIYIIESLENLSSIPYDKRKLGAILSVINGKVYSYGSTTINDDAWCEPSSWKPIASGSFSGVSIYSTLAEVEALTFEDNQPCVYCVESQQIYKYFKNGSQFTDNPPYVIPSGDDSGVGKYVSLFFMNSNASYNAGEGISIDTNNNIISVDWTKVAKKENLDYTTEKLQETADLLNDTIDEIEEIEDLIPNQATPDNQLADKDFVNSSIINMAARYITYTASGEPFPTHESLINATEYYFNGSVTSLTMNDYTFVIEDEDHPLYVSPETYPSTRYMWTTDEAVSPEVGQWNFQYIVNNTPFTSDQWKAINSTITKALVDKLKNLENCSGDGRSIEVKNHVIDVITDTPMNDTLVLSATWTNSAGDTSAESNYSVEVGDAVSVRAVYKWESNLYQKDPKTADGISEIIPDSGVESDPYEQSGITSTTVFTETFYAPVTGLVVNDNKKVVYASEQDKISSSVSVTFKYYRYYGASESLITDSDGVKSLPLKNLALQKELDSESFENISVENTEYFYYAYPKSYGQLTKIYQNYALDVIEAFDVSTITVTNDFGVEIDYYVYRSKKGAFTNKALMFVF